MSLLAFMAVAVAGIRSVRSYDIWGSGTWVIGLENGSVKFLRETGYYANGPMSSLGHISGSATARRPLINFRFSINSHDVIPNRPGSGKASRSANPTVAHFFCSLSPPFAG